MGLPVEDITKQAVEVIFSVKKNKPIHPDLHFNGIPVAREDYTKHLGVYLDSRLNFSKHITESVRKATKGLSLLKYLSKYVSRKVLDMSYKLYVRPHLDYGDVIYHNQREDLMSLVEQVQYKAALKNFTTNLVGSLCPTDGGVAACPFIIRSSTDLLQHIFLSMSQARPLEPSVSMSLKPQ